jgi:protein-S-isoprenylcysteine O-methyltransferase Ste14
VASVHLTGFTATSAIRFNAGEFLVLFAWPFEYGAPMTMPTMVVAGIFVLRRRMPEDEVEMLAIYGDAYAGYMRETDAVITNVW